MAVRRAAGLLTGDQRNELPETVWYTAKRRLLGPPMINAQLREQRLSKFLALGVLSPDGISSSAYGTEEILIELIQLFGLMCGSRVRFRGQVGIKGGAPVMANPAYELIVPHVAGGSGQND